MIAPSAVNRQPDEWEGFDVTNACKEPGSHDRLRLGGPRRVAARPAAAREESAPRGHCRHDPGGEGRDRRRNRHEPAAGDERRPGHAGSRGWRDDQGGSGRGGHDLSDRAPGHPGRDPRRRARGPAHPAEAPRRGVAHLLLHGVSDCDPARLVVGRGAAGAGGPRDGQRGPRVRRGRAARPRAQHPPQPARRPQLRILLRGSAAVGQTGRGDDEGRPVAGRGDLGQALRRQRPRVEPQPARDLPACL